jgi:hypothetical protein
MPTKREVQQLLLRSCCQCKIERWMCTIILRRLQRHMATCPGLLWFAGDA